jgi:HAD superfamily hydrolase (TIGR01549 family)
MLLLFDIDGTLVRVNGAGRSAVENALSDLVGQALSTEPVSFSGKTDPQIVREVFAANGIDVTDELVDEALSVYAETASAVLQDTDVTALPGAVDLVRHLAGQSDVRLGIVTGNVRRMAYRKLDAVDLSHHFPFGAFGCDHADRNRLPPLALRRAAEHTGQTYEGAQTVVIGDTVHDIECGRVVGARCVGVTTGSASRAELAAHDPDLLLDDLRDTDAFLRQVVASG